MDDKEKNIDISNRGKKDKKMKNRKDECEKEIEKNIDNIDIDINEEETAGEESKEPKKDDLAEKIEIALKSEKDKYLRLYAEYDNFRKRTAKEKTEIYGDAVINCINEILPAIDNFERALQTECADEKYKDGINMIFNQLTGIMKKLGVEEIEALGAEFDPNLHNAIKQGESDEYEENTVCEVFQKGYTLNGRVVRHAMVAVTG